MFRNLCSVIASTLLSLALCFLVIPPEIALAGADSPRFSPGFEAPAPEIDTGFPPSRHDFVFGLPELGIEMRILGVEGGFLYWQDEKPDDWGFVPDSDLSKVRFQPAATDSEAFVGGFTLEDALGTPVEYRLTGHFDGARSFQGSLSSPGSGISHLVHLTWAEDAPQSPGTSAGEAEGLRNIQGSFLIILGAGVVAALVCGTAAILQECGSECSDACEDNGGVDSFSEGLCGTCDCDCQGTLEV